MELRPIAQVLRFRWLEPERCIHLGAPLDAQSGLLDDLPVTFLRCLTLRAPKRLRHLHEIMPLGFGDQPRKRQKLAPLLLA